MRLILLLSIALNLLSLEIVIDSSLSESKMNFIRYEMLQKSNIQNNKYTPTKRKKFTVSDNQKSFFVDLRTGLMWSDSANQLKMLWPYAKQHCENLELNTFDDWYLPTLEELMTIVEANNTPNIIKGFINTLPEDYWSSDTQSSSGGLLQGWYAGFHHGGQYSMYNVEPRYGHKCYVKCVRSIR